MKKSIIFKRLFFLCFMIFLMLYIYSKTGYYEARLNEKKTLTETQMALFEEDIAKGIAVDINDYLPKKEDYSNYVSRGAYKVSEVLNNILNSKVQSLWNVIKTLFIN